MQYPVGNALYCTLGLLRVNLVRPSHILIYKLCLFLSYSILACFHFFNHYSCFFAPNPFFATMSFHYACVCGEGKPY